MWSTGWCGAACALSFCALFSSGLVVGCGSSGGGSGDDSTGGSGGSNALDLGLPTGASIVASINQPRGECMSAADCSGGAGAACATVAGAYRVCTFQAAVATMASSVPSADQCGPGQACASGNCYPTLNFAGGLCGAGTPVTYNVCRADACSSDAMCGAGSVCGPRGFSADEKVQGGAIRQCLQAACKSAADCTKQANGICGLVQNGCSRLPDGTQTFLPAQLACVYPRGCTNASDCPNEEGSYSYCRVVRGEGVCILQRSS